MKNLIWILAAGLLACGADTEGNSLPPLTREQLLNPESCKDCHPKHYAQWSSSMHAYATKDPVFVAMNKRGQEATGGTLGKFCVNCHAPMAVLENKIPNYADLNSVPEELQGVTCYFCHNAIGVGSDHSNANLMLANDTTMRAALNKPVEPSAHKVGYSVFHDAASDQSSLMCGTCHDLVNPLGVHLERTYQEYSQSIESQHGTFAFQSCQDCHMPKLHDRQPVADMTGRPGVGTVARDLHEHLWPAVDIALSDFPNAVAQRSAVEDCALPSTLSSYFTVERDPGPQGLLRVTLEAQAGHAIPSGAVQDRRLWVELIAYDANNVELFRSGVVADGAVEDTVAQPHPCIFRERLADAAGNETHMFWEAASITASRLLPQTPIPANAAVLPMAGGHSQTCSFRPPVAQAGTPPDHIDLRVRMRPMGIDVLQDLVTSGHLAADVMQRMPTFTIESYRAVYAPASASYTIFPAAAGDCDKYRCMFSPDSEICRE